MAKSSINKWLLGLAAIQLGLVAFIWAGKNKQANGLEPVLADVDASKTTKVVVQSLTETLELSKKDGAWVVSNHFDFPVKGKSMEDALVELGRVQARSPMSSNANRHDQLGVSSEQFNRKVQIWEGESSKTIWIGNSAGGRRHSLRLGEASEVYAATGVQVSTWSTSLSSWVETKLFDGNVSAVESIEVTPSEGRKFEFVKKEEAGGWAALKDTDKGGMPLPPFRPFPRTNKSKEFDASYVDGMISKSVNMRMEKPADPNISIEKSILVRVVLKDEDPKEGEAISPLAPEIAFSVGQKNDKGERLLMREGKRPVWVSAYSVQKFLDFKEDKLYKAIPKEGDAPPQGLPNSGGMPQGLPPGLMQQMQMAH